MSEISLGQFTSSFLKSYAKILKGESPFLNEVKPQTQAQIQKNNDFQNQLQTTRNMMNQDISQTRLELMQLNSSDKLNLLKDLLNLPKEFKDLLNMLGNKGSGLNLENTDLSKLLAMMQTNGKSGLDKLMKMTSELNKMGIYDTKFLKELQMVINACVSVGANNNLSSLKNVMLLYLPWLPLGEGVGFDLEVDGVEAGKEDESVESVTAFITTVNYGNVKVVISKDKTSNFTTYITACKEFPISEVNKRIAIESNGFNVKNEVEFDVKEVQAKQEEPISEAKVNLISSKNVNQFLILMAHTVIKIVIEIDKNFHLKEERKKILEP